MRPVAHRCAPLRRPVQAGNPRGVEDAAPYNRVSYCLLPQFCILHSAFCIPAMGASRGATSVRRYGGRCRRKPAGRRGRRPLRSHLLLPIACRLLPQFCILHSDNGCVPWRYLSAPLRRPVQAGNPRGVGGAAPYDRVSYCLLPAAYCLNSAFCIPAMDASRGATSVRRYGGRCGLRAAPLLRAALRRSPSPASRGGFNRTYMRHPSSAPRCGAPPPLQAGDVSTAPT